VRIMAATNRDLEEDIESKRFRQDLYYRLAVVTLTVPPLRERREDIRDLAESYISHFNSRLGRTIQGLSESALHGLLHYSWPGNVRELINVMERAVLLCGGEQITPADLPHPVVSGSQGGGTFGPKSLNGQAALEIPEGVFDRPWSEARQSVLERFERAYFAHLLSCTGGVIGSTAERAGIQPRSLFQKMKQHGLQKEDFKQRPPRAEGT
jgi:DNA-binding NtrC family response regulator